MIYYHVWGGNGYPGCDFDDYIALDEYDDIETAAWELAYENAECYEYGMEEDNDAEREEYYNEIDYAWEEITEEEYKEKC